MFIFRRGDLIKQKEHEFRVGDLVVNAAVTWLRRGAALSCFFLSTSCGRHLALLFSCRFAIDLKVETNSH